MGTVRTGYTLFELLLVLAILIVIGLLTLPSVSRIHENYRLQQATAKVKANLAAARIHAIDAGVSYAFRFEPGGRHYVIIDDAAHQDDGKAEPGNKPRWTYSGELPAGFHFGANAAGAARCDRLPMEQFAGFELADELALLSWSRPLWFHPDGTADDRIMVIADSQQSMRVLVRGLTGDVSLERGAPGKNL